MSEGPDIAEAGGEVMAIVVIFFALALLTAETTSYGTMRKPKASKTSPFFKGDNWLNTAGPPN